MTLFSLVSVKLIEKLKTNVKYYNLIDFIESFQIKNSFVGS